MIRLVQRKLIIPRGDTGSFTIPAIAATSQADVAVFTIFDCLTRTKVCEDKIANPSNDTFTFVFTHGDTVNLKPGKYMWDVKFYKNPVYADGKLVNGEEIDSYYAGYSLPNCEIRETGDDMLVSPDAPGNSLTPAQIDIITAALNQIEEAVEETQSNVAHYPYVGEDDHWYVWDAEHNEFVDTGVIAAGPGVAEGGTTGQILKKASNADFDTEWGNETDPTVPAWAKAETKPTYTAEEVGALPDNTFIPTNTSDLNNDSNFAVDANYVHTDNNYTSEEKLKLSGIAAGAEVNVNADWTAVSGDAQILNKPTNVSSFTNDAGYLVAADIEGKQDTLTFDLTPTALSTNPVTSDGIKDYVDTAVSTINTMRIHICTAQEYDASTGIPTVQNPDTQTFYLVPGGNSGNLYIEWVYVDNAWERFGSADIDLSGYALKSDTVLDTTLSRGRAANTEVGTGSFAFGDNVTASGVYSHAEGRNTVANHQAAHAEGLRTTARYAAHAEGESTIASGQWSHAEGCGTEANGAASYAGGKYTIANGTASHVFGEVNVADSYDNWPLWVASTEYNVGDRVKRIQTINNEESIVGYICKEANSDSVFTIAHWNFDSNHMNYAEIVGNGTIGEDPETHEEVRNGVNIRTLDWYGNEHLKGDLYVQDNANGTGGVKVATINQIPEVPVTDVQVNGTSVVTSGVANIPVATTEVLGAVKVAASYGITIAPNSPGYSYPNALLISPASSSAIKQGTNQYNPIVPANQSTSIYYGLSKLAGVDLASESVTVGTYPDSSKTAINTMIGSVSKYNLDNAGITAKTYDVKFDGEFSVTTATNASYISPYARASVTGRISKHYMHRVTVNGTEYILPTRLWYEITGTVGIKVYEYLGNLGLYKADVSGVPDGTDNVPFVIISDLNNSNSIDVLTQTAGTYTIKVEQINNTQTKLPNSLIWADNYVPIEKKNNYGTYNGFSIGVNELKNTRGTFAIGYANSIQNEFNIAIGSQNVMTGNDSIAIGHGCNVSGTFSTAFGVDTRATTDLMFVLGRANRNANTTIGTWATNTYYEAGTMVRATISSVTTSFICKISHTSSTSFVNDFSNWAVLPSNGDTAFVIGNGMLGSSGGSNAVKINWAGGAFFGSDVYVNCDNTSANGKKVATVDQIPSVPVQDVQINGTSIISSGVANIPIASNNNLGVVKVQPSGTWGLKLTNDGLLYVSTADSIYIKNPDTHVAAQYTPISLYRQHESVFYGLAKAAGDTTQSASANAVGTYTDAAKAAIQHMLGTDTNLAPYESDTTADAAYAVGEMFMLNGKLHHATAAIAIGDTLTVGTNCAVVNASEVFPHDVQVNGTSVVTNGVANIPKIGLGTLGVVKAPGTYGVSFNGDGELTTYPADTSIIKTGNSNYRPIVAGNQHTAVFYGLAKAAGDTSQTSSSNAVGTYTADAKAAIQTMLGVTPATIAALVDIPLIETVTGTTPTITGQPNTRYNCGEVTSISITPPSSGGVDVFFTSGSTPALLTVPNTVVWPEWFDATTLDTNTVYEILIIDGTYGSVMTWAT